MRRYVLLCAILGVVSLCFFILTNLASFDISRGKPNLAGEWRAMKVAVFPMLAFHVTAIIGLFKVAARVMDQRQSQRRSSAGAN